MVTPRVQLDRPVNNQIFEEKFSSQFSPKETEEFEELFFEHFGQIGYFCRADGYFDFVLFAKWLESRYFVDTSKRHRFTNLHDYIERILTFFVGSEVLSLWNKLNRFTTCPEDLNLL